MPIAPPVRGSLCILCLAVCSGCLSLPGIELLGENFPPYDIEFLGYEAPSFPSRLRATSIGSGYGIVVVTIDEDGRVDDAVVVEASHSAFAEAILEVVPAWVFDAASAETVPRREVLHYFFRLSGVATSLTHRDGAKAAFESLERHRPAVRTVSPLDVEPHGIGVAQAGSVPAEAAPAIVSGTAEVSFVIDQTGNVRVPVVTASTDPALGAAALATVEQWRFVPPTFEGSPVLIEVVRSLTFAPDTR
jgi:TonB family protein